MDWQLKLYLRRWPFWNFINHSIHFEQFPLGSISILRYLKYISESNDFLTFDAFRSDEVVIVSIDYKRD